MSQSLMRGWLPKWHREVPIHTNDNLKTAAILTIAEGPELANSSRLRPPSVTTALPQKVDMELLMSAFSILVTVLSHYQGMVAQSNVVPLTKAIIAHRKRLAGREEQPHASNPTTKIITARQMEVWMVEFAYKCVTQEY